MVFHLPNYALFRIRARLQELRRTGPSCARSRSERAEGEFLTLLGASGSGKTTCLMMLAGFEMLTSGTIRIHGRSVHARHRGGFQNYALFPHMTVGGNLAFPLEVRADPGARPARAATCPSGRT